MSISVDVPNPFVSIASWATQKALFSKLILERSINICKFFISIFL